MNQSKLIVAVRMRLFDNRLLVGIGKDMYILNYE